MEVITILAILIGPVLALQLQKHLESRADWRRRKLAILESLLATRAARLSAQHVQSLNMIDYEFRRPKSWGVPRTTDEEKRVLDAWKSYRDVLGDREIDPTWSRRRDDAFVTLLYEMSRALGYDFDRVELGEGVYSPQAHGDIESDQYAIRRGLADMISGKRALPIQISANGHTNGEALQPTPR